MVNLTSEDLFFYIMNYKITDDNLTYLDCISLFMEEHNLEQEVVVKLIDKSLKEKIEEECVKLSLIKKQKSKYSIL